MTHIERAAGRVNGRGCGHHGGVAIAIPAYIAEYRERCALRAALVADLQNYIALLEAEEAAEAAVIGRLQMDAHRHRDTP